MIDVLTRVDAICKKYERYDAYKHRGGDGDLFSRLYAAVDAEVDAAVEVSVLIFGHLALGCHFCPWLRMKMSPLAQASVFFLEISSGEGEAPGGVSSRERRRAADQGAAPGGGGQAAEDSRYEGRFT
jgi:hypothetical protein